MRWLTLIGFMIVLAVDAAGCGASAARSSGHEVGAPGPSPSPTSASLPGWQKLGATEVPPMSLQRVSLGSIAVVNQTGGAVSDGDARTWAQAYMREFGYLEWAVNRWQAAFLLGSGLSSAPAVFQSNLNDIAEARQAGERVGYQQEAIRRLVLRAVPQSQGLQAVFNGQHFTWKPYAMFVDALGPVGSIWTDAQGHRTVKNQIPAGGAAYELVGGELSHDPLMGDVWVVGSDWDCTDARTVRALAPLCNP
jgi:hypothetical protein